MSKKRLTLFDGLRMPRFGALLKFRFFFNLAFTVFISIFALYAQHQLQLSPDMTDYVLAYMGVLIVWVLGGWDLKHVSRVQR